MWPDLVANVFISFFVGIFSNLATAWVAGLSSETPRRRIRTHDLTWGLGGTIMLISTALLLEYRWAVTTETKIAAFVISLVASLAAASVAPAFAGRIRRTLRIRADASIALFVVMLLAVPAGLDEMLPHYIALDCPSTPALRELAVTGRVTDPASTVSIEYSPLGQREQFVTNSPMPGSDGEWFARVPLSGAVGDRYQLIAITARGDKSRLCVVTLE